MNKIRGVKQRKPKKAKQNRNEKRGLYMIGETPERNRHNRFLLSGEIFKDYLQVKNYSDMYLSEWQVT